MADIYLMKNRWSKVMKKLYGSFLMTYGTGLTTKVKLFQKEFRFLQLEVQTLLTFLKLFLLNFLKKKKDSNKSFLPSLIYLLEFLHYGHYPNKTQTKSLWKLQMLLHFEKDRIVQDESLFKSKVLFWTEGQTNTAQ